MTEQPTNPTSYGAAPANGAPPAAPATAPQDAAPAAPAPATAPSPPAAEDDTHSTVRVGALVSFHAVDDGGQLVTRTGVIVALDEASAVVHVAPAGAFPDVDDLTVIG